MEARSDPNRKDSELIEMEDGSEEPSKNFGASPEAESTGAENSGEEKAEEGKTVEEEDKGNEEDVTSQRCQTAKVGIFDVALYSADVVTDGVQVATHYSNCHWVWAALTALFMIFPAMIESVERVFSFLDWVAKDCKFRVPFAILSLAFFTGLFTRLAHEIIPEDTFSWPWPGPWYVWVWVELGFGFVIGLLVVIGTVFVASTTSTLKGYAALMAKQPNADGSVSDPKMLDGVKGKLKEVILEAAPQSNLQVKFLAMTCH